MANDHTDIGGVEGRFRTTRWSLVSQMRDRECSRSREIMGALFQDYWKPVYCYVRNSGIDNERAKDLTQDFFCSVLFEKNLFAKADKSKGRLRSLILASLRNFLLNKKRYHSALKRASYKEIFDVRLMDILESNNPPERLRDEDGFNYAWIASLLDNVAEQVKRQYCSKGKEPYWYAFDERFMSPTLENYEAPCLSEICRRHGIEDEVKASNMITTVKRCFRKILRAHIREYVHSDSDVDEELGELISFLRRKMQDGK